MVGNSELRRRLQKITDDTPVYKQENLIAELASTFPHSIRCLEDAKVEKWNCFAYAFNLVASDSYQRIAWADRRGRKNIFFASAEFTRFLMQSSVLGGISEGELQLGDVGIYLDDEGIPKHAGKIFSSDKRVRSKWGIGRFWEHGLWEVPESYGNTVSLYREIPTAEAQQAFLKFVRSREGFEDFVGEHDLKDLLK